MYIFLLVIISILVCGLFAGMELGSFSINRVRLQYRISQGRLSAKLLYKNLTDPQVFVFTMLIFQNVSNYISSLLVTYYYININIAQEKIIFIYNFIPWSAEIAATLTLLFPIFIFAEIAPKNLFRIKADILMYRTAKLQTVCIFICKPLTLTLKYLAEFLSKSSESELNYELSNLSSQKLKMFFSEGSKEGTISDHQHFMISNTLKIHMISVSKLMIPINKIITLPLDSPFSNYLQVFKNLSFNHIPISSGEKNNIIGTIDFFSLLTAMEVKSPNLINYLEEISMVNWDDNLQETFYKLQKIKDTSALVKNKKDEIIGIIFLKDIVNYITEIV